MTQQDKNLLIKDLCARLPYETKIEVREKFKIATLLSVDMDHLDIFYEPEYVYNTYFTNIESTRLYLFPMASMTAEQHNEAFKDSKNNPYPESDFIDYLNAHHFDYRGLIEKGLAIDATNLNVY